MEKIIDFKKSGNAVRFYIGTDDEYHGDDWNDVPYEHNAGRVYDEYITRFIDVAFSLDLAVLEPEEDWRNGDNSHFSKDDMKAQRVPCIVVSKILNEWGITPGFCDVVGDKNSVKFYFGDPVEKLFAICKQPAEIADYDKHCISGTIVLDRDYVIEEEK